MTAPAHNADTTAAAAQYRRIKSQNGGPFSSASLWLADDHILQISSWGVQENYQRVYFRDLKAVLVAASSARDLLLFAGVCGAIFFGFLSVIVTLTETLGFGAWFLWFLTLASLATAILALLRGRQAKVYAVTALQTVCWRPLARRRQVDDFILQLRPLVETAQADLIVKTEPSPPPQQEPA